MKEINTTHVVKNCPRCQPPLIYINTIQVSTTPYHRLDQRLSQPQINRLKKKKKGVTTCLETSHGLTLWFWIQESWSDWTDWMCTHLAELGNYYNQSSKRFQISLKKRQWIYKRLVTWNFSISWVQSVVYCLFYISIFFFFFPGLSYILQSLAVYCEFTQSWLIQRYLYCG